MLKTSWESKDVISLPVHHDRCAIGINDINIGEGFMIWTPREPSKYRIALHTQPKKQYIVSFVFISLYVFYCFKKHLLITFYVQGAVGKKNGIRHGSHHPRNPQITKGHKVESLFHGT